MPDPCWTLKRGPGHSQRVTQEEGAPGTTPALGTADWTQGVERLVASRCASCGHRWYLPRNACPRCGSADLAASVTAGTGTVVAATTVHRAPPGAAPVDGPFGLVLVDLDDGVRVMGRSPVGLRPGERVAVRFDRLGPPTGERPVPFFEAAAR